MKTKIMIQIYQKIIINKNKGKIIKLVNKDRRKTNKNILNM